MFRSLLRPAPTVFEFFITRLRVPRSYRLNRLTGFSRGLTWLASFGSVGHVITRFCVSFYRSVISFRKIDPSTEEGTRYARDPRDDLERDREQRSPSRLRSTIFPTENITSRRLSTVERGKVGVSFTCTRRVITVCTRITICGSPAFDDFTRATYSVVFDGSHAWPYIRLALCDADEGRVRNAL